MVSEKTKRGTKFVYIKRTNRRGRKREKATILHVLRRRESMQHSKETNNVGISRDWALINQKDFKEYVQKYNCNILE